MTPKENVLNCLNHRPIEWTPIMMVDFAGYGFSTSWFEKGPMQGGKDAFGVNWVRPASGGGAPIPEPGNFLLNIDNFTHWRDLITIPKADEVGIEEVAKMEFKMMPVNRDEIALEYASGNGVFERLAALMGFEDALIALVEEPETVEELFDEITKFKIDVIRKVKTIYDPDFVDYFDDIATERGMFMSKQVYRELIKPFHKKFNDAVKELDMIPIQHTCGYCQDMVEDFIEVGAQAWTSVQPTNDIEMLCEKYGDRMAFIGGFNTNGRPGQPNATEEEREAEIHRCLDTYGKYDSFILGAGILVNTNDPKVKMAAAKPMMDEAVRYAQELRKTRKDRK